MKAKNNAQASLTLKRVISSQNQKRKTRKQEVDITELTTFFEKHFTDNETDLNKRPVSFYQLNSIAEVASAIKKLSNHKAPGPDETTGEDLKKYKF